MRVLCEKADPVWRLRFEPGLGGHVSLDPAGIAELAEAVEEAAASGARALVLTSAGPEFCAGMDLAAALATPAEELRSVLASYAACLERLASAPLATIAVVEGKASGGGVGLAAACDLVIAGPRAIFALPEASMGLVPAVILPALQRRLRAQQVRRLALFGEVSSAAQAQAWGLVDVVAEDPQAALATLLRGSLRARPQAVAALKRCTDGRVHDGPAQTAGDLADPELRGVLAAFLADGAAPPWFTRLKG